MSKVLIYSQEDLDLILELEKEKNEELQQENQKLKDRDLIIAAELTKLQDENKILKENAEHNDKVVDKVNWENMLLKKENQELKYNWNKLKEWLEDYKKQCEYEIKKGIALHTYDEFDRNRRYGDITHCLENTLKQMQEIEGGING